MVWVQLEITVKRAGQLIRGVLPLMFEVQLGDIQIQLATIRCCVVYVQTCRRFDAFAVSEANVSEFVDAADSD